MEQKAVLETTEPTKPDAAGLTNAIEVVIQQIKPRYQQLKIAHKIAQRAGNRATDRSIRVDARAFEELEQALAELKRFKARLQGEPDDH